MGLKFIPILIQLCTKCIEILKTPHTVSAIMTDYDYYRKMIEDAYESQGAAVYGIASGSAAAAAEPVPDLDIAVDVTAMIAFANVCMLDEIWPY